MAFFATPKVATPLQIWTVGFGAEASAPFSLVVRTSSGHHWSDKKWMESRAPKQRRDAPIFSLRVHLGSWQRDEPHQLSQLREIRQRADPLMSKSMASTISKTHCPSGAPVLERELGLFSPLAYSRPVALSAPPSNFARSLRRFSQKRYIGRVARLGFRPLPSDGTRAGVNLTDLSLIETLPIRKPKVSSRLEHADFQFWAPRSGQLPHQQRPLLAWKEYHLDGLRRRLRLSRHALSRFIRARRPNGSPMPTGAIELGCRPFLYKP